ncbi:MAG: hypothetical protein HYZ75_07805 [Elusimicrobia bacterium]|nr:hypothetical protein [Elusimicrobiota bacterium]
MRAGAAVFMVLGGPWAAAAEPQESITSISVIERSLPASTTSAWSAAQNAFELARGAQGAARTPADKAAADGLAASYDQSLSPSLRLLGDAVSQTRDVIRILASAHAAVGVNARHGRPSSSRDPHAASDANAHPQPVDFKAIDGYREVSRGHAVTAANTMKRGLLKLRTASVRGVSPSVRKAYQAMVTAFEASMVVAFLLEDLDGPKGPIAATTSACREYYAAANKELKPMPEAHGKVIRAYGEAAPAFARIEAELAGEAGKAQFLKSEVDRLGSLRPKAIP